MASLRGFPLRLTPLMARTRSPMWMAPVLQGQRDGGERVTIFSQTVTGPVGESCQTASDQTEIETKRLLVIERNQPAIVKCFVFIASHWLKTEFISTQTSNVLKSALCSPFCQTFLGEARNDDGVKRFLRPRYRNAQGSVKPLQLNCVDYGAWHLQLIYSIKHTIPSGA